MFWRWKKRATSIAGIELLVKQRFRDFELARVVPYLDVLICNFDASAKDEIEAGRIDPLVIRQMFVDQCKDPWATELPILTTEFFEADDIRRWMSIVIDRGEYEQFGAWFNEELGRHTQSLLVAAVMRVGDLVFHQGLSEDRDWE